MNNKTIILIIALLTCVGSVYSQGTSPALADTEGKYKYNYVPVSPVSEELMKHIMCPVNYNTGKVELSIPIYEIRTRDFTLPLRCNMTAEASRSVRETAWQAWAGTWISVPP